MSKDIKAQKLIEEISLLIKYAVPENEQQHAVSLAEKYGQDRAVLTLLREYYSTIPEAREEGVERVINLVTLQGVSLFVAVTESEAYLYVVSSDKVVFLGVYGSEVDEQVLSHFGYESQDTFLKKCLPVNELEDYDGHLTKNINACAACSVKEGEFHLLGCVVEICPWCDGQLSNCNCRFEQLGVDEIESEEQLDDFYDLLREKGRVTFKKDQIPLYPGAGNELDKAGNT